MGLLATESHMTEPTGLALRPRQKMLDFFKDCQSIRRFVEILVFLRKKWDLWGIFR